MQAPDSPLQQIINALVPLVVTLVGLLFSWLTMVIKSKIQGEWARGVLLRISEQARDVVLELNQDEVALLREQAKDGKLDAGDVDRLKELALLKLKAHLGQNGRAEALKALGFKDEAELERVLRAKLEAEVAKFKASGGLKVGTINVSGV